MLQHFLQTIQHGEVQSLTEIAHVLGISADMTLRMVKELTTRGYLQEIGADCAGPQKACPECPVNDTCQVVTKRWFLTEKGRAAVAAPSK